MRKKVSMVVLLAFALTLVVYGLSLRREYLLHGKVKQDIEMRRYEVALNDLEKAETDWSSLASKLVKNSQALRDYNEGIVRFRLGEYELAKSCFEKAFKTVNPVLKAKALHNQGNVLLIEKDFLGAAEKYKEVLAINPNNFQAKTNLEIIRAMQRQSGQQQGVPKEGKKRLKDLKLLLLEQGQKGETPSEEKRW